MIDWSKPVRFKQTKMRVEPVSNIFMVTVKDAPEPLACCEEQLENFEEPETVAAWVSLYKTKKESIYAQISLTKPIENILARKKVTLTVGEFDE